MVTMVLLKDACTCTNPWGTCLRSFFLKVFFFPFFSGAAAPPAAAGFAIVLGSQFSVPSSNGPASQLRTGNRELRTGFLCLCRGLLLVSHCALARAFSGSRI